MLEGLNGFFKDQDKFELAAAINDIYISVSTQQDFEDIVEILRAQLA